MPVYGHTPVRQGDPSGVSCQAPLWGFKVGAGEDAQEKQPGPSKKTEAMRIFNHNSRQSHSPECTCLVVPSSFDALPSILLFPNLTPQF